MQTVLLLTTLVDLAAVAALAWLVLRSGREREASLALQRATLDSLRGELAQLILEAERRAQSLDETLADRERRLRVLLDDLARVDPAPPRPTQRRPDPDPAEARLLRDLELHFAAGVE